MDIIKSAKEMGSEIGKGVDVIASKVSDGIDNIASHLPFSNLAKKEDNSFHIEVDFPGVTKDDIDIKIENNMLIVSAERSYKNELTRDDYYICESSFGKLQRQYTLPESVDTDKVEAKFEDGRLTIELEKNEKEKAKSISIK